MAATDPAGAAPQAAAHSLPRVLWPLMFGNIVIGSGVMVVAGTLNEISTSLRVSVATAGQLISASALLVCLGAPLLAAVVAGWDRRRLLSLSLCWFGALHLLCTLMPSFATLLPMRVLAMVAAAVFTPQAAACVGLLVPPALTGRAITFVFLGWSVASVLGMPTGALIGGLFGWRAAFALVGTLALVCAVWLWRAMPDGVRPPALSRRAWSDTLRSPALMLCIGVTVLFAAGQFVLFSYLAPYFKTRIGITPVQLSLLLAWFGAFGLLGNVVLSRQIDRIGAPRAVMLALGSMALSLLIWPLGSTLWLAALVAVPWALGNFAANSAQQARLVRLAPTLASASISLNTSAIYAGQALGAATGGWLIAHERMDWLNWCGLASLLLAMTLSARATQASRRHKNETIVLPVKSGLHDNA